MIRQVDGDALRAWFAEGARLPSLALPLSYGIGRAMLRSEPAPHNQETCRACGETRAAVLVISRDHRYGIPGEYYVVRCRGCGLMRTSPMPSDLKLMELYECYYVPRPGTGVPAQLKKGLLYGAWNWWSGCGAFRNLPARGKVLDVGCLRGDMMAALKARGHAVVGLEPNPKAAAVATARGLEVHVGTLLTTDLPVESFDTIILSQVLEHTADPLADLRAAWRLLRGEGRLVIACPNSGGLLCRAFGPHWIGYHLPFHIHHFDRDSLAAVLRAAGFRIVRMTTHTPDYWVILSLRSWLNSTEGRYCLSGSRSHLFTRAATAPIFRLLDMLQVGDGLLVVAERRDDNT